jgi:acyl CoA:acetate/3-ketoacid CoA transferase
MSSQEVVDLSNESNPPPDIVPIVFLTTFVNNRVDGCELNQFVQIDDLVVYISLRKIKAWLTMTSADVQLLNVTNCYKECGNVYKLILDLLKNLPAANDRYGALIKTELEFLSLL